MSIHRPKRATSRRSESTSPARGSSATTASVRPPKWKDIVLDKPAESFLAYSPGSRFEQNALVNHPKFGKGVVLEVDGNKVHVLFEEGLRKLLHGTQV
jgi:hypothetical protein